MVATPNIPVVLAAFLGVMVVSALVSHRAKLPYTLVLVFIGIGITGLSALTLLGQNPLADSVAGLIAEMNSAYTSLLAGGLFVGLVVPPLVFAAMIHVSAVDLKAVARPSVFLATGGVVIATIVGGSLISGVAHLPIFVSFLIAAIIAPTDVVTVLEVFRRLKVPSELVALMDLEAAINDATAIAVFTILIASASLPGFPIVSSVVAFLIILGGGALVGLAVAFAAEATTSLMEDRVSETLVTIAVVYGTYALASSLGLSGLVGVAVAGLYFGNLTLHASVGAATRESIAIFWEVAAFLGTSVAFLFVGFQVNFITLLESIPFIVVAYVAITAARALAVYPTFAVFRAIGEKWPFSWSNVAFLGGTRGALSIALAASLGASQILSGPELQTVTSLVFGVAFLSLTIQVPVLNRYVRSRFESEQSVSREDLDKRVSEALMGAEGLLRARREGGITDEEFVAQLETRRDDLSKVIEELESSVETRGLLRARASMLYHAVVRRRSERQMEKEEGAQEGSEADKE